MQNITPTDKKLGIIYTKEKTTFRVWSPLRDEIYLVIYLDYKSIDRKCYLMEKGKDGVHEITLEGDYKGCFYNYIIDGEEITDPYSIASSLNSKHSAIIDLKDTNPVGWESHYIPKGNNHCDAIIYEVHIKDFTGSPTSGAENRGKYLGFIERNTNYNGITTGLDHLRELGVTHIHLLPVYDFITVNEDKNDFYRDDNYNWGYDPELYNVPEGSYATIPENPVNRIKELKKLIMGLHDQGFKVVVDVVYNHTYKGYDSNLNLLMPNYYYRMNGLGRFSDGSGCGNELATERPMVRKLIIDSLLYWLKEYKVDGFRFDLMALIDIDTIEEAIKELRKIKPDILIYGEPWAGGKTTLPNEKMTTKGKQTKSSFALFNDEFRDSIKGDNNGEGKGFIQGNSKFKLGVESGITGSIYYDNSHIGFTQNPRETINYINSHDDLIIYDKIKKTFPHMAEKDIERLNRFAFSILFTSQGIPFFHGGNEFLRTKQMISNTYKSPLSINAIDWSLKEKNLDFYNYFKDLIQLRKKFKEFRLCNEEEIRKRLRFFYNDKSKNTIVYTISTKDEYLLIFHNGEFYSININKENIIGHLNNCYGILRENIKIYPVLNIHGLVKEKDIIKEDNIKIPYFSTAVYKIK